MKANGLGYPQRLFKETSGTSLTEQSLNTYRLNLPLWISWPLPSIKGCIILYRWVACRLCAMVADSQCLPILISLETSENDFVAERAMELHRTLHAKHSTLVNVRYLDFAKASYDYQRSITAEVTGPFSGPLWRIQLTLRSSRRICATRRVVHLGQREAKLEARLSQATLPGV